MIIQGKASMIMSSISPKKLDGVSPLGVVEAALAGPAVTTIAPTAKKPVLNTFLFSARNFCTLLMIINSFRFWFFYI